MGLNPMSLESLCLYGLINSSFKEDIFLEILDGFKPSPHELSPLVNLD